jgi:hypothetical protein
MFAKKRTLLLRIIRNRKVIIIKHTFNVSREVNMEPHAFFLQDSCEFLYNFQFIIRASSGLNALSMRDATGLVFVGIVNKRKAVLLH